MDNGFTILKITDRTLGEESQVLNMSPEDLVPKISEIVESLETTPETLMEMIVEHLNLTPELICSSGNCWEEADAVYQIFHVSSKEPGNDDHPAGELNQLATLLMGREEGIYGDCILFKAEIHDDHHGRNSSVSVADVEKIIRLRLRHTGVKIPIKGEIEEFKYQNSPIEIIPSELHDNYSCVELKLFTMTLLIYFQLKPVEENNRVNRRATRLFGEKKVFGPVYLINRISEHNYGELTKEMTQKLLRITFGPLKERDLRGIETEHGQKTDGKPKIINMYRLINLRDKEFKKQCHYCKSDGNLTICTGCYRLCYCSRDCQQSDWRVHKDDCIRSKRSLNETTLRKLEDYRQKEIQKQIYEAAQKQQENMANTENVE